MNTHIHRKPLVLEFFSQIMAQGKWPLAILLAVFFHIFLFKTIRITFPVKSKTEIPILTFLGPILSAHDFLKTKGIEGRPFPIKLPGDSHFIDSQGQFSPAIGTVTDKTPLREVIQSPGKSRLFIKDAFLDKTGIENKDQQKILKELGIDVQVPRYHSLRSFHEIQN